MIPAQPSLIIQSPVAPSSYVQDTKFERLLGSSHTHVSTFRSLLLDMRIYSPSVKVVKTPGLATSQFRPVFGEEDKVEGKVMLDPSCSQNGRLTISLEGAFEYSSVKDNADNEDAHNPIVRKHRPVFLSSSATILLSPIPDSRSTIREALTIRKRPSTSSLNSPACRSCEFGFELPRGSQFGEQMPSTFSSTTPTGDLRRPPSMEEFEVAYRITAVWEACDGSGNQAMYVDHSMQNRPSTRSSRLEAPVLFQPDTDFQSIDSSALEPQPWLELPLMSERPIPFNCAVTLPYSQSFSRRSSITYFVVFATNTGSPCLIKEIAADATIVVSLTRKITFSLHPTPQTPTLPDTPPTSDDSDNAYPFTPRSKLLRRSIKTPIQSHIRNESFPANRSASEFPREAFSVSRTLQTQVSIGFPKRPRANDMAQNLPDGLYKGKVQLSKDMLPNVNWPGISVKVRTVTTHGTGVYISPFCRSITSTFRSWSGRTPWEYTIRNDAMDSAVEHPTSTWEAMPEGNVFYRRLQLYSIPGKLPDLSDFIITGCRNGGPIALMRDTSKIIAIGRAGPAFSRSQIQVFSSADEGLLLLNWDQGKIIRFGWTADERLVVVNEEGVYRLYDLQGDYQQHSLGSEAAEMGIIDARIHENGLVALTGSLTLLEIKDWEGGKPLTLANPGLSEPPHAWAVIPPDQNISRHVEVLLSVETTILAVDNLESLDQRVARGPFRGLAEFDTQTAGAEGPVNQVEWCGNDAILVTWNDLAILVGPSGDTLRYFYSGAMFSITELDGVRVIGQEVSDFIQKVPVSSMSVFRPGSTSPSAILFDAWESFTRRSSKADESIRTIRPELAAAVNECIDAAGHEWEPYWQRRLLSAAKFGWGFLDLYNPGDFVAMGQALKVLNSVRFYEIGIPLTYSQYQHLSPMHLITRLTSRNLHLLALRISSYLSLKADIVLKHWAGAKIARSKSSTTDAEDEELCKVIVDKFEKLGKGAVSYADIARRAWEVGRAGLATKLLDHETRASDQVPLLLTMKEDKLALLKAADSGDTELVYHVLLHLHKRLPLGSFFRLIEDGGERLAAASRLLQVYAREQNREMLRDFYYSDDRRVESAVLALEEASQMTDQVATITSVKAAETFFSEDKDRAFEAKMMDESARLLAMQQQLEKESDGKVKFFGKSVSETIRTCLMNAMSKKADKVKSEFKVPDKRFWYIKLHTLTALRDFNGLDAFARSKRSPIGYEAFVRHLVEAGHLKEAASYVIRCDAPKRVGLYVLCEDWRAAGRECKERGDKKGLEALRKQCPNSLIARELDLLSASMK
ncbi:Vps16, C-terminal region-domain-containing protein [Boletus reticuloceps]|uniref:Vps16, C-terminal region-domain-containing protein n=1 Tax=Boletus reticuloceps TaxID=495285 RepID=A0A8I3AA38_9AGAM|nr:Vps16, C-terminal region-domain-containing protein [Boletus reticuloceps]